MTRTVRTLDVMAAISMILLALVCAGWAVDGMQMPIPLGKNCKATTISRGADARLIFFGGDKYPWLGSILRLSDSRGTRTISADEAFDLPGIFYRNFQGTGIGGPLWTLTISLYYLMLLFSITPVIWLVFNRRSQAANAVGTPPAGAESFSLKNLFIAVTLVAVAAGMQALLQMHSYRLGYALLLWYGSGALVGAAIFGMVRRPIVGAFIGLVFQGLLIIVMKTLFKISL